MMKTLKRRARTLLTAGLLMLALTAPAFAASDAAADASISGKAIAAAIVVGLAAAGGAIAKSVDGISRQPEAEGKIRTTLMLGLVFVETAIIYALIVAILIIFVL